MRRQPSALSAAERQSVEQNTIRRRAQLTDQRETVESATESLRAHARKQLEDSRQRLAREHTLAGEQAARQRQEFGRRTVALQQTRRIQAVVAVAAVAARAAVCARTLAGGSFRFRAWAVIVTGEQRITWSVGAVPGVVAA